jgi:hypothetical protein
MTVSSGKCETAINWKNEFLRPWKLATLILGIILLLIGSAVMPAPDWDVGVSLIMAILTYLTAPWFIYVIRRMNWKMIPLALFLAWLSIDGCYWLYWTMVNPGALFMRSANAFASTFLYLLMGMVWMYSGSLLELLNETMKSLRGRGRSGQ